MKLIGYLRVSTKHQLDGYGLDVQETDVRHWAKANDHRLVKVCAEKATSGTLLEREAWSEVDQLLVEGRAQGVLVPMLNRLARDVIVQETMMHDLWRRGFEIFSTLPTEQNLRDDPDDPSRKLFRLIMGAIAAYERDLIVLRLRRGRAAKARKGGFAYGSPPFGFHSVDKELVPEPREQRVLLHMLALRRDGLSTRQIAEALNKGGHWAKRGGHWSSPSVSDVLRRHEQLGG